ncbi:hypothetical protein ACPTE9_30075, partial [Pseudomonas aeruginosa]|uniref:hypothetical protein n=1 Tax=Pseudomonas aeruginosa TaxID=287 RepID=UPI003CC606D2
MNDEVRDDVDRMPTGSHPPDPPPPPYRKPLAHRLATLRAHVLPQLVLGGLGVLVVFPGAPLDWA